MASFIFIAIVTIIGVSALVGLFLISRAIVRALCALYSRHALNESDKEFYMDDRDMVDIKDVVDSDRRETVKTNFMQSLTSKGITIALLTVLLLIPGAMIRRLIEERQGRSRETIRTISSRWSNPQTLCAPVLIVPYTVAGVDKDGKPTSSKNSLYLTPKELNISASLTPEKRYYGIYKAILYKGDIHFKGEFSEFADHKAGNREFHFDRAKIAISITDLKGVTQNPELAVNGRALETDVGSAILPGKVMIANLKGVDFAYGPDSLPRSIGFDCKMKLNGSGSLSFIPLGQNNTVTVGGPWQTPSFIGEFSPESEIDSKQFNAVWNILGFNRDIPKSWSELGSNYDASRSLLNSFGVNLIETVDHYQQNMRSAKYALMFIALTFIVFFFVEIFTKKPIHIFQYVLVGIALILFYSLLLSLSEHVGFGLAYLAASCATILLTTLYFYSLIRQVAATSILAGIMISLYTFLYVILQTEDYALLFGSIFLFVVLGVIMFVSNKIKIGKADAPSA